MSLGPQFWRFWAATVLVNVGDGIRVAAFPLLAASITDDPFAVGGIGAAASLPWLVTGLFAGALADRRSARALLMLTDAARLVVLSLLVVTLALGQPDLMFIAVVAFVLGVGETVRDTTAQTAVPRLVAPALLERANGRLVAGEVVGNEFAGPLIGGALFATGAALPFIANSAALAFAVLLVLSLPTGLLRRQAPAVRAAPNERGIRGGVRWLARHRTLRMLVLVGALVAIADGAWFAIFVLYAEQRLGLGSSGFGMLLAVGAAGGLLGAWLAERVIGTNRHGQTLLGSIALTAIPPALLIFAPTVWAAIVVMVLTSGGFGVFNVAAVSLRHRLTPERLLGRVVAASRTALLGAGALGALAGGSIAATYGLDAPLVAAAALGTLAGTIWLIAMTRPTPLHKLDPLI